MSNITDRKSEQTVNSKYFSTGCVMDESLTDFQEPKKLAGPKTAPKKKSDKPKKAPKRIRGQKDIRKALQSKKNELESYSKEFDNVCRQAGLDVDPEQLQLAIALSKSLQQPDTDAPETPLTTQDRVGKIRTTLLEYGFKVPEIKIKKPNKRCKRKKLYKLLLTSDEAKRQIIADKYSQVLFQNIIHSNYSQIVDTDVTHIQLYNLATNASYDVLKKTDTFYVNNLLEKSTSTGNLLRDWSEIPGRPVSPKLCEPNNMNFSEIECSQDELDVVLSGTLKSCKNIIKAKEVSVKDERDRINNLDNGVIVLIDDENLQTNDTETLKVKKIMMEYNVDKPSNIRDTEIIELDEPRSVGNQHRSCSPDLFDDDPSTVDDDQCSNQNESPSHTVSKENSFHNSTLNKKSDLTETMKINSTLKDKATSLLTLNTNVTKGFGDFMEITECVDVQCVDIESTKRKSPLILSQNITKRQSNDFMEITNCVVRLPIEVDVDLTQSPDNEINIVEPGAIKTTKEDETCPSNADIDSSRTPKYLSMEENSKSNENNIEIIGSPKTAKNSIVENIVNKGIEILDLTQSSNTSDELPFVSLTTSTKDQSADNTIIIDPKDYEGINESVNTHGKEEILDLTQNINCREVTNNSLKSHSNDIDSNTVQNVKSVEETLDLTQDLATSSRHSKTSDANVSFFEDYVHDHSDHNNSHNISCDNNFNNDLSNRENEESSKDNSDINDDDRNSSKLSPIIKSDDIDLTQNSESSEDCSQNFHKKHHITQNDNVNEAYNDSEIDKSSQSDIDMTQNSESEIPIQDLQNNSIKDHSNEEGSCDSVATIETETIKSSQRCSSLGKIDNVSIDYDEMYDNMLRRHTQSQENRTSKSTTDNNTSNVSSKSNDISNCSQNSEVFVISDNELDYSMHQSRLEKPVDNFQLGGISIMDEFSNLASFRRSTNIQNNSTVTNKYTDNVLKDNVNEIEHIKTTPVKHKRVNELATPQKPSCSGINTVETPNNQYVIKTVDITPMPMYDAMSLEELHSELDKFGVKPFKRKRAVQLLTHIYNQIHPTVEPCSDEESPCKRRRTNNYDSPRKLSPAKQSPRKILAPKRTKSPRKIPDKSPNKVVKKRKEITKEKTEDSEETERLNDLEIMQTNKNYDVKEIPVIKETECSPEDWVFQKREKAKIHSCRVPLHIAFHNYVLSRPGLREAILCYEPINIDEIHKDLVGYGHRYDPKDLLKYMDKKCITVKTTDNDARNHKR